MYTNNAPENSDSLDNIKNKSYAYISLIYCLALNQLYKCGTKRIA